MGTIWRNKSPGEKLGDETINVSDEMGDGGAALLVNPGGVPDWVRDPSGNKVRVKTILRVDARPCGKCGAELPVGQEVVVAEVSGDSSKLWFVYACPSGCGFVWEQRDAPKADEKQADEKLRRMKEWLA